MTDDDNIEDITKIGHWDITYLSPTKQLEKTIRPQEEMPDIPRTMIRRDEYKIVEKDKFKNGILGYYDSGINKNIIMFTLTDKNNETLFEAVDANEYAKKNPLAQYSEWLHELGHYADDKYHNIDAKENTPTNTARFDRVTERKSIAIQYLAIADKYNRMKKEGITEFQYNGQNMPLDDTLKMCPGLKEVFEKYGTNIDSPKTSYAIVEAAQKFFEDYRKHYDNQSYKRYCISYEYQKGMTCQERKELAQNEEEKYKTTVDDILKKVNIGERYIDLSHCKDLIDTMSEEDVATLIQSKKDEKHPYISSKQLLNVYDYANSKGVTDDAMDMFLFDRFLCIVAKEDGADTKFRDILLKNSPENQVIIYYDKTKEDFTQILNAEEKANKTLLSVQLQQTAKESTQELTNKTEELKAKAPIEKSNTKATKSNKEKQQFIAQQKQLTQ